MQKNHFENNRPIIIAMFEKGDGIFPIEPGRYFEVHDNTQGILSLKCFETNAIVYVKHTDIEGIPFSYLVRGLQCIDTSRLKTTKHPIHHDVFLRVHSELAKDYETESPFHNRVPISFANYNPNNPPDEMVFKTEDNNTNDES